MIRRHKKPPKIWLMTDPRLGAPPDYRALYAAVQRLPFGSGVIFRHYELEYSARRTLFKRVQRICKRRGHRVLLAGNERQAVRWRADGCHNPGRTIRRAKLIRSIAVHNNRELNVGISMKAALLLISPVYATGSHPGRRPLGVPAFRRLALRRGKSLVLALGGLTAAKAAMQDARVQHGWAAIDAFRKSRKYLSA